MENGIKEQFTSLFVEILTENDYYNNFKNIGLSSKKFKSSFTISPKMFEENHFIEIKSYYNGYLNDIISDIFVKQQERYNKVITINYSPDYIDESVLELEKVLIELKEENNEKEYGEQFMTKIKHCFYSSEYRELISMFEDLKDSYLYNERDIEFDYIKEKYGNNGQDRSHMYLTSGPILDINGLNIIVDDIDETINQYRITLEIPIADLNFIEVKLEENTLYFERLKKLERIIKSDN